MSYTYVSAVTRATRQTVQWTATDLSQVPLNTILQNYYEVSIELSNPFDASNTYLTTSILQQVMPQSIPSPTLTAWLASLGSHSLPTTTQAPSTTTTPVLYSDAWQAGFVTNLTDMNASPDASLPDGAKNDLLMTKAGLDMASMSNYLLTTVNGYLHLSGGSMYGLYVKDGGKSLRIRNRNHIGVMSFYPIGQVQQIPITPDMVYNPSSPAGSLSQAAWVDLGVSLAGKIVLLSIGGYLHALDDTYVKTGDSTIKILFNRIAFPERIYQSQHAIDLSSLPLVKGPSSDSQQYTVASIYSDATVLAYLTLSQSFAIVVDTEDFYVQKHDLECPNNPGRYFGTAPLRYPLIGAMGKMYEYRLSQEMDTFVYGTEPMQWDHYLFQTMDWQNYIAIGPNREGSRRWSDAKAYLLEMGSYT